jgi:Sulfotransferase family
VRKRPVRKLDFTVIGAARSGTTSLWAHLRAHPEVFMPGAKEVAFFSHDQRYARTLGWYMQEHFGDAPADARYGTATPHYMRGRPETPVEEIARRIHDALPDVRLIAILRDPVARATSHWVYATRGGGETRPLATALAEQLEPAALQLARREPQKTTGYLVWGEYGRILAAYRPHFPPDQMLILLTTQLETQPQRVMQRVYAHIGVDPEFVPAGLETRHHRVGLRRRISEEAERELLEHLDEETWSRLKRRNRRRARRSFDFWFRQWNMIPDEAPPELDDEALSSALAAHYAEDAELLARDWGVEVPWRVPIASARTSS